MLLDLDTVGEGRDESIKALRQLRAVGTDLVLLALTRWTGRKLRLKAIDASVDEYFTAPFDFAEVELVLGRSLEKRALEIDHRRSLQQRGERQPSDVQMRIGFAPQCRSFQDRNPAYR